jgi:Flp pilus assembly protein TadG
VEFVLLLPVLLLLVFGILEFGRAINYWIDMTHLANEGARYASVNRWPTCTSQSQTTGTCNPTTLKEYLVARANTDELRDQLNASDGVQICYPDDTTASVPPTAQDMMPGDPIRVIVNAHITLPVLDSLLGLLGSSGKLDMRSTSTMRLEWIPDRLNSAAEGMVNDCP